MKNRNVWRVLSLVLALVMMLAVVACTNDQEDPAKTTAGAGTTAAKQTTTAKKTTAKTTAAKTTAATTAATTAGGSSTPDPNAPSVYSGTPDTSWFDINNKKTEYTLTTADQFVGLAVIRQTITKKDFTFEGVTIKLDCDVVINAGTSEEIKANKDSAKKVEALNSSYLFKGTFDGQGHSISGYYLPAQSSGYKGLFGGLGDNAVIKDLVMTNCYGLGTTADKKSNGFLAGVVKGKDVLISNVVVDGLFENGGAVCNMVGGLIGSTYDDGSSVTFKNCEFNGTIKLPTSAGIGGILGELQVSNDGVSSATLIACKATVTLEGTDAVGGLVGSAPAGTTLTVNNCSATATIACGTENKGDIVGLKTETSYVEVAPTVVALTSANITTTLPEAFANAVKVLGSSCEAGATATTVNDNQYMLKTDPATPNVGSAHGVQKLKNTESTKTATDGIWHYYFDAKSVLGSNDDISKCYITWTFELTEAGTYNIASYHRLKNDNRGGIITIDGEIVIDFSYTASDIATESRDYLNSGKTVPVITDEYAGAYMNWGVAIELEAGAHTITYTDTDTSSVHWRDFYFAKVEPAPAA